VCGAAGEVAQLLLYPLDTLTVRPLGSPTRASVAAHPRAFQPGSSMRAK